MSDPYSPPRGQIISSDRSSEINLPGSDLSRSLPRQLSTGSTRGTQTVGYGSTKIDGTNNTITIGAPDGSTIGLGAIPTSSTGEYGFFSESTADKLVMKIVNGTYYIYDVTTNKNIIQIGLLPNGTYGMAVAKTGYSVSDAITP